MTKEEIMKIFNDFCVEYNFEEDKRVWKNQSEEFRQFWREKILNDNYPALSEAEMDYVIRFFDSTAWGAREFKENGHVIKLPLKMMIGASNEYPSSEETGAMYDRFNLKYETTYIEEDSNFLSLLNTKDKDPEPTTSITLIDLQELINKAENLVCSKNIMEILIQVRRELKKAGIILSPRRWKKAIRLIKAKSLLRGGLKVEEEDLGFLSNVLWNEPEQRSVVIKLIAQIVNPLLQKAMELMDMAAEIWSNLEKASGSAIRGKALIESRSKFGNIRKQLLEMKESTPGKWVPAMENIYEKVSKWQRVVAEELTTGTI